MANLPISLNRLRRTKYMQKEMDIIWDELTDSDHTALNKICEDFDKYLDNL